MTTAAAENLAGDKGKDKAEKRRALGRGLESLLPGPRVVPQAGEAHPAPQGGGAAGKQQVPHFVRNDSTVRNDNAVRNDSTVRNDNAVRNDSAGAGAGAGELRSAGQPGAAVPTYLPQEDLAAPYPGINVVDSVQAEIEADVFGDDIPKAGAEITLMAQAESRIPGNLVVNLAIADIDKNPFQTRYVHSDTAFEELTASVKANGVLQPIVVRPGKAEGRYILILGQRRLHASKVAGNEHIPAIVRRVSEQQAAEMTIIENLQREDLSPLEQAQAFKVLSEEFKMTQAQIGERVGLSRESVSNYMRLLKLPRTVMELLAEKKLKFAEARELLKLEDDQQMVEAALFAVKKGMTAEQVEKLVMQMGGWLDAFAGMPGQEKKPGTARWVDPNVRSAQMELERLLGVKVKIRDRKGKGKIVIEYHTVDDYERVVGMLRGKG